MYINSSAEGQRQRYRWPSAALPMAFGSVADGLRQSDCPSSADEKTFFRKWIDAYIIHDIKV